MTWLALTILAIPTTWWAINGILTERRSRRAKDTMLRQLRPPTPPRTPRPGQRPPIVRRRTIT